jgi:eukaryotic-like serine/threonine-protein kinase
VPTSSTEISREALAFLQRRVALFGLAAGSLSLIFLLFRAVVSLSRREYGELVHPSFLLHLVGVVTLLSVWVACRTGARSRKFVHNAETTGLLGSSVAYQVMGWYVPLELRPDFIVLLAMTYVFVARAVYVPSSARRTLLLSLAVGIPLVVGTDLAYRGAKDAPQIVTSLAVWWSLTTILTTATTSVIYGLRREVREARKLGQYTL